MKKKVNQAENNSELYPDWICENCGTKEFPFLTYISTYHHGECGWCKKTDSVTSPRNFGYPIYNQSRNQDGQENKTD